MGRHSVEVTLGSKRNSVVSLGLALVPAAFLTVMVLWPLVAVLDRSLAGVGLTEVGRIAARSSVRGVVVFTVAQAALSTLVTFVIGLPIAHGLARYQFWGRAGVRAMVVVPFVLPTVIVASAVSELFGRLVPGSERSLAAIVAAHVFFNVAVVVRVVGGFWATNDRGLLEAGAVLGASRWAQFWWIEAPRLAPVMAAAGGVVFLFSFTSFGVIRVLGGPTRATVETDIYRYAVSRGELDVAAVLALIQILVVGMLAVGSARLQRTISRSDRGRSRPTSRPLATGGQRLHLGAVLALAALVVMGPLVVMVEGSLRAPGGYSLVHYRRLFGPVDLLPVSAAQALGNSLQFAVVAALIATVLALAVGMAVMGQGRLAQGVETLGLVPLGVSAVTLGFGYVVAFSALDLRRSIWLVPMAHAVIGLPFVLASLLPALRAIDPSIREVAATMGASPLMVRRAVEWPLIRRAVLTGAGFAAAVSIGEFGATSFLARGADSFTAPMAVFRLIGQPGEILRPQALALSVLVGLVVAVIAAAMEWGRDHSGGAL